MSELLQEQQPEVIEFSEWEGCKENIQPLKKGRKASSLRKVFAPLQTIQQQTNVPSTTTTTTAHDPTVICFQNHNEKMKLGVEREQWEKKLLEATEDPLLIWLEYLTWIEDSYPTLNKSSMFVETLQRCTRTFTSDSRYKNDRRFMLLWLRYADTCSDPIDVFTFMHTNGIGLDYAEFYIAWATVLEDRKDLRAADAVLDQGATRQAQPTERMKQYHEGFKQRFMESVMKNIQIQPQQPMSQISQQQQQQPIVNPLGFQRVAFNPLSTAQARSGDRPVAMQTPVSMTPIRSTQQQQQKPAIGGIRKPVKKTTNSAAVTKRKPFSTNFQVFDETSLPQAKRPRIAESSIPSIDFNQTSTRTLPFDLPKEQQQQQQWNYLPSEREQQKENQDQPTPWTSYKVPLQSDSLNAAFPVRPVTSQPMLFTVFEDEQ
jgi:hypothetical protein